MRNLTKPLVVLRGTRAAVAIAQTPPASLILLDGNAAGKTVGRCKGMKNRRRGSAIVETALMMPWIVFLFVGVLDFGFYAYAAICTQNAARAAAIATSANSTAQTNDIACTAALRELSGLPNMIGVTCPCPTSAGAIDSTHPFAASVVVVSCPDCADCTPAACSAATPPAHPTSARVSVTYRTIPMVPIPGVLTGQMTLTRSVEMRIIL